MNEHGAQADVPQTADAQAAALVEEIASKLDRECAGLLAAAAAEGAELRRRAREKARRQLQRALDDLRQLERERTRQLDAELDAERRKNGTAHAQQALAAAWPQLRSALEARWHDDAARQRWIGAQIALAQQRLVGRPWRVRHPATLGVREVDALRALLATHGHADAELVADGALVSGLVIESAQAWLDSTPAALCADHSAVEAALLAALVPPDAAAPVAAKVG